jgi:hypothetical protein
MHETAKNNATRFFNKYVDKNNDDTKILEIGSWVSWFNIRDLKPKNSTYIGVDLSKGPGVDVVLTDPYKLPFDDNSFD